MKTIYYPVIISFAIVLIIFGVFNSMETSLSDTLHLLSNHPIKFGIASFLILASDIVLPVPSSIVLYINGYFLGIFGGTVVSILGLMVGSIFGYYIGQASSSLFQLESHQRATNLLAKYGPAAIFLSRGIPILSESVCFVCGYNKTDFKNYVLLNFIGYLPLCLLHAIFGKMGHDGGATFILSFVCSIAISVIFWFFGKKILPRNGLVTKDQ